MALVTIGNGDHDLLIAHAEAIIQSSNDAIVGKNLDGIIVSWNPGLKVVAEGIETSGQAEFLTKTHNCDYLQGYLFGKPEPASLLSERLHRIP